MLRSIFRYCGEEVSSGAMFESETNIMALYFQSHDFQSFGLDSNNRGFKASVTFQKDGACKG